MRKRYARLMRSRVAGLILILLVPLASPTGAQSFAVLHSFSGADGAMPSGSLIRATDGYFYGTTASGGSASCGNGAGCGTVYRIDALGALSVLHSFSGEVDGRNPSAIIQAPDGFFYGTTSGGGGSSCGGDGCGTIFRMDPAGNLTTLHAFAGPQDGSRPNGLTLSADGNFYGTTFSGGGGACPTALTNVSCGTVFRMDSAANLTTMHYFSGPDGAFPIGSLTLGSDGNLYGATLSGGPNDCPTWFGAVNGCGTIFVLQAAGEGGFATVASFAGNNGARPTGGLVPAGDGMLYGTTTEGFGANGATHCPNLGNGAYDDGCGTVFRLDPTGTTDRITTLYSFQGPTDGAWPTAGLNLGSDGALYGTASIGGGAGTDCPSVYGYIGGCGTVFRMDTSGHETTIHTFSRLDGSNPAGALLPDGIGNLYGTASAGGTVGDGTVFRTTPASPSGACPQLANVLCLDEGRFLVEAQWEDFEGNSGLASVVPGATSTNSGVMWFFSPDNWELLIKVLDGCAVNGHYWVLGAAATNVQYTIQVTDTQTGEVKTYSNPLGTISPAITDTGAFAGCP